MDKVVKFRVEIETNGEKVLRNVAINADDFKTALQGAVEETERLQDTLHGLVSASFVFSAFNDAIQDMQSLVGGLADEFDNFDKSMRAVNTMAGLNASGIDALTGQVNDLAEEIPLAKEELAGGLYQVISNGVPEDNWIDFLNKSAKAT
jgi:uncharacterized phage infection (PIP) family protein YhgE